MDELKATTNTYIQYPSRIKQGAKTKKDLYVRVYGHNPDDVRDAKAQILNDFGPHRGLGCRITLKMEISYTDHSHLIGCRGATIRRVMEETGCHIHFPDSNRMSKVHKCNQVIVSGSSVQAVEQARSRVRELSPLLFHFILPMVNSTFDNNPDAHHVFIENIQTNYNAQVTIHPPNKLQQTSVTVKGCEIDSSKVKEATAKIVRYFSFGSMAMASSNGTKVESTMEISAAQHRFVRAVNDANIHSIRMNTGAKIIFPDLSDASIQEIKRSRVYVSGDMNCVYKARQQLIGCLPLSMTFDLVDDFPLDWATVRMVGSELNVNMNLINRNRASGERGGPASASLPPPIPSRGRAIQLIAAERNTANIYEARRRILGSSKPPVRVNVPSTYALKTINLSGNMYHYGNRLATTGSGPGPLPPLMLPPSPNMLSPVLSSFWPPNSYASPLCSPPIAPCVVNNGSRGDNSSSNLDPPLGSIKSQDNMHSSSLANHGFRFNGSISSSSGPTPEFNLATINAMKQNMHSPLMMDNNHSVKGFPTPASSTISDNSFPINPLIEEFSELELKRKAPGWGRSVLRSSLAVHVCKPRSEGVISEGSISGESTDNCLSFKNDIAIQEKKCMAVKAMYNPKWDRIPE